MRDLGAQLNLATRVVGPTLAVRARKAALAAGELGAVHVGFGHAVAATRSKIPPMGLYGVGSTP
eukprot:353318-Alexandrium_andersonii.AAC.1